MARDLRDEVISLDMVGCNKIFSPSNGLDIANNEQSVSILELDPTFAIIPNATSSLSKDLLSRFISECTLARSLTTVRPVPRLVFRPSF